MVRWVHVDCTTTETFYRKNHLTVTQIAVYLRRDRCVLVIASQEGVSYRGTANTTRQVRVGSCLCIKVVSDTFLLFYFLSRKKINFEIRKNIFYFTSKSHFVLEKFKLENFRISNFIMSLNA